MTNFSDKSYRENQNTILYSVTFFPKIVQIMRHEEKCG